DLVGVKSIVIQREIRAEREHLLDLVVGFTDAVCKSPPEGCQLGEREDEADLLLGLPHRLGKALACAQVPSDGNIERAGPGVLRCGSALEQRERSTVGVDAANPDVERSVPVTVAVDVAASLGGACRHA